MNRAAAEHPPDAARTHDPRVDRREALLRHDRLMMRVRWFGAPFALAQFILYKPPPGVAVPFNAPLVGIVIAALVVGVNLIPISSRKITDVRRLWKLGFGQLVCDALIVIGVVWLFSFDGNSALWALLILPVIEGAIRFRNRGAMSTWAGSTIVYLGRSLIASHVYPGIEFRIDSISYRMGIVLIVAIATGYLSDNLQSRIVDELAARHESDRRAELLQIVAAAGRSMTTPDLGGVLSTVVDSSVAIGFQGAAIGLLDPATGTFRLAETRGLPINSNDIVRPATDGLVGDIVKRRETVVINDYSHWEGSIEAARPLGFHAVVGTPVWCGTELDAVLIVGMQSRRTVSATEIECIELLATQAGAALSIARRFDERHELQQQLEHQSLHDALTGMPNRLLFLDRLAHCLERKVSQPSPTAVLYIDVDGFKKINESLGHEAGDHLLALVGQRLQSRLGPADTVARFSSDEFAILIEEPDDDQVAVDMAHSIIDVFRHPFTVEGRDAYVSVSIGLSQGSQLSGHDRDFLREADLAMYRAKEQGGARWEAYRPAMTARAERRLMMEQALRLALERDEFVAYFQPVVSTATAQVVGLEALARWVHPERAVIPASEFVPFAEETGLIIPLGRRILDDVCAQINRWHTTHPDWTGPVSVNLSAREFRENGFIDRLVAVFDQHHIDPSRLIFELTENIVIRDDPHTLAQMNQLSDLGVRLAVDDFGLGYSSLIYLKRFPFSILKIDKSFVAGIIQSPTDQAIVKHVLGLAKDLDISVVAEGVETEAQLDYLKEIGCAFAQGYHVSAPLEAFAVEQFVTHSLTPA